MSDCEAMRDRMPAVLHGGDPWSALELEHVAVCPECSSEWDLVRMAAAWRPAGDISPDRVTTAVLDRLRTERPSPALIRRLPWRGATVGLVAAAACIVLLLALPRSRRLAVPAAAGDTMALAVLPELQQLDDTQLQAILRSLGPTASDATPGVLPHLEDLTDSELEQLLQSEGGE